MKRETLIWLVLILLAGVYVVIRVTSGGLGLGYETNLNGEVAPASQWEVLAGSAYLSVSRTIGIWVGALFTLFVLSFAYRDNPFYKIAESVFVGVSAAYWMVVGFWTTVIPNLFGKLFPGWINSWAMPGLSPDHEPYWWVYFVPLLFGGMLLWRLAPVAGWIARWPLAFIIGSTAGIRLVGFIHADFLSQIRNSIVTLFVNVDGAFMFWQSLNNLIMVIGVLACLVYFFFSFEHRGIVGKTAKLGIWFLMVTFGAAFGYTVMGRIALLAIRLEFLFDDWLWIIDPTEQRVTEAVGMLWYLPGVVL